MADDDTLETTRQATLVDYERLELDLPVLRASYAAGNPFPHLVFDDVLFPEVFDRAATEFPAKDDDFWKGYLHVNETKYANTQPDTWGPTLTAVARELCSQRFVGFLEQLTGIEDLMRRLVDGRRRPAPDAARRSPQHPRRLLHPPLARRTGPAASTSCFTSTASGATSGAASWSSGTAT